MSREIPGLGTVELEYADGLHWATSTTFRVFGYGASPEVALQRLREELEVSREHFVDCDPGELSASGLEYRAVLQ